MNYLRLFWIIANYLWIICFGLFVYYLRSNGRWLTKTALPSQHKAVSVCLYVQPADAKRPGFGTSDPGGSARAAIQTRCRWPSSSGLGPRADRPNASALGAVSRSAYFIGTRAPSRPPEGCGPRGSVPVDLHHQNSAYIIRTRPTSSGLGLLHQDSDYIIGTRPTSSGLGQHHQDSAYIIRTRPTSSGLGLHHQDSVYIIGTRPTSSGLGLLRRDSGPEQTARTRRPSGHLPSEGMFQSRPELQSTVGDGPRGPAPSGTAATRTVQLAYNARLVFPDGSWVAAWVPGN